VDGILALNRSEFGKAVSKASEGMSRYDQAEFEASMREAYRLRGAEQQALSKADETSRGLNRANQEQQAKIFSTVWDQTAGKIGEYLVKVDIPDKIDPDERRQLEAYNLAVDSLRPNAEKLALAPSSPETVAQAAIKAAAYEHHIGFVLPRILQEYESLARDKARLEKELNGVLSRNPNRENLAASSGGGGEASRKLEAMGHTEAADAVWGRRI
jgi:hypothetical protein